MPQFIRLATTVGTQFVNVHFIQSIRPKAMGGVAVTMPNQELFVENAADMFRLAKATKLPIGVNDYPDDDKEDFKLSLWM